MLVTTSLVVKIFSTVHTAASERCGEFVYLWCFVTLAKFGKLFMRPAGICRGIAGGNRVTAAASADHLVINLLFGGGERSLCPGCS